jgi:hypothetical protein
MAWRFNGQTDYATLATNAALSLPQNGSLGGWAYRADSAGTGVDYLLMHGATTANPYWFFAWSCDSAGSYPGRIRFYTKDSAGSVVYLYGESAIAGGAWHHVMATWDATALRLYIDGVMGEPNPSSTAAIRNALFLRVEGRKSSLHLTQGFICRGR